MMWYWFLDGKVTWIAGSCGIVGRFSIDRGNKSRERSSRLTGPVQGFQEVYRKVICDTQTLSEQVRWGLERRLKYCWPVGELWKVIRDLSFSLTKAQSPLMECGGNKISSDWSVIWTRDRGLLSLVFFFFGRQHSSRHAFSARKKKDGVPAAGGNRFIIAAWGWVHNTPDRGCLRDNKKKPVPTTSPCSFFFICCNTGDRVMKIPRTSLVLYVFRTGREWFIKIQLAPPRKGCALYSLKEAFFFHFYSPFSLRFHHTHTRSAWKRTFENWISSTASTLLQSFRQPSPLFLSRNRTRHLIPMTLELKPVVFSSSWRWISLYICQRLIPV